MAVDIVGISLPIVSLIVSALLTIPIFKIVRKTSHKTALTLCWFIAVFLIAGVSVANLALTYYSTANPTPLNLSLNGDVSSAISSSFLVDAISIYMAIITVFFVNSNERPSDRYFAIMLILTAALLGAVLAGDLLTFFIFWEVATAAAAFLMMYRKSAFSLNATLKYLIMVIIASAFVLFGLSIVYGITGSLNYIAIRDSLSAVVASDKNLLIIAFVFIAAGYAIEAAIVPFHFWLPDAYQAAPAPSSAFLSALVDQGSYYILIRILLYIVIPTGPTAALDWTFMVAILAALTMIVGNVFALIQNDVKRLIAYICVADVGYNLIAITSYTSLGLMGNLYFFLIGGITTALAFMVVGIINKHGFKTLEDISGLGKKMPLASLALVIAGLSFIGVPPFGGFIAKYLVFTSALQANLSWLAIIGVVTSVIQAAYLFRLIHYMYARKTKDATVIKESKNILIPIFILAAALLVLGLFPQLVLNMLEPATRQLQLIVPLP
jgi:NADH-quinone oxidoreductase subunit N